MFTISPEYFYFLLTVPFIVIWALLFYISKSTRKEQKILSLLGAVVGPLSEVVYTRDFWLPQGILPIHLGQFTFLIEDALFGAAILGIASIIFEVLFRTHQKRFRQSSKRVYEAPHIVLLFCAVFAFAWTAGVNSIYASAIAFVVTALPLIWFRRDLFVNALFSAIAIFLIMFCSYFLIFNLASNIDALMRGGWLLFGTPLGSTLVGIPVTELIWGFTLGFLAGPLYEFVKGLKIVTR